jgi:hypothetical protein
MLKRILLMLITLIGFIGVIIFGYNSLIDWNALQLAYKNFIDVSQNSPELTTLFVAQTKQQIHRINLFAEGVWTMQSAILSSIGVHGICTISRRNT